MEKQNLKDSNYKFYCMVCGKKYPLNTKTKIHVNDKMEVDKVFCPTPECKGEVSVIEDYPN